MASKLGRTFLRAVLSQVAAIPVRCSSSSSVGIATRLQAARSLSSTIPKPKDEKVMIHFVDHVDGTKLSAAANVGDNLLDVVIDNDLDIDGFGACEGTLACSTCHLIFKPEDFSKLPDDITDEELDMLDLAYGLCDTSRLGCQVLVTKEMEDWEVSVPSSVSDARSPS